MALAIAVAALAPRVAVAQLPCVRADRLDGQPWVHHSRVLESFPEVIPAPTVVGSFQDRDGQFWLRLWRDEQGYFGELASPILEADSPTSRLRNLRWSAETRELSFAAAPTGVEFRMDGILEEDRFVVARVSGKTVHGLVLLKEPQTWMSNWKSRAQFECAMELWRRQ